MGTGRLAAVADTGPLIHLAEIECLDLLAIFAELCSQLAVEVLLTDDLIVRRAAKDLGLVPVGSLGIIARAHRVGRIDLDSAERHLMELRTVSSLFVTQAIVDLAIERLRM